MRVESGRESGRAARAPRGEKGQTLGAWAGGGFFEEFVDEVVDAHAVHVGNAVAHEFVGAGGVEDVQGFVQRTARPRGIGFDDMREFHPEEVAVRGHSQVPSRKTIMRGLPFGPSVRRCR